MSIGIPEAALIALKDTIDHGYDDMAPEVLAAALALDPGDTYTNGLRRLAKTDESLLAATLTALDDAKSSGSTEHFAPITAGLTWLTGQTIKS